MRDPADIDAFIAHWRDTDGSELANTQSFINGLCHLLGVDAPAGSRTDDKHNDYVFERRVFQDNGDGTQSFGRIDCYKRGCFILEAKQGSEGDRAAAAKGEADLNLFGQTASARVKRGTARRGTPGWAKAMVQTKGQAERYAKALPADHGWPQFLLVADIGYWIEVFETRICPSFDHRDGRETSRTLTAMSGSPAPAIRSRSASSSASGVVGIAMPEPRGAPVIA